MSDILNIRVTERELELIMDLLHEAGGRLDADGQPAVEICHDLMEQSGRWAEIDPTDDLTGRTFEIAEDHMIQAGIDAREQAKASSRAAERRALNFSARDDRPRSETQKIDVWAKPSNDPADW
tara:strand:+ start:158 stop:526 length:369 start_codon:yes stop_codon:yes gene_type:complete